ncbi:hypothetical protein VNO78_08450 [Psophocarpus tetragonolobus]|uniref:Uncharacterized protein n=1 Tax=Psophocarpus tetragonolobus TaxID=3891 RepID=A0AAN9SWF9_PSOTE
MVETLHLTVGLLHMEWEGVLSSVSLEKLKSRVVGMKGSVDQMLGGRPTWRLIAVRTLVPIVGVEFQGDTPFSSGVEGGNNLMEEGGTGPSKRELATVLFFLDYELSTS